MNSIAKDAVIRHQILCREILLSGTVLYVYNLLHSTSCLKLATHGTKVPRRGKVLHAGLGGLYGLVMLYMTMRCMGKGRREIVVGERRIGENGISILTHS